MCIVEIMKIPQSIKFNEEKVYFSLNIGIFYVSYIIIQFVSFVIIIIQVKKNYKNFGLCMYTVGISMLLYVYRCFLMKEKQSTVFLGQSHSLYYVHHGFEDIQYMNVMYANIHILLRIVAVVL